MSSDERAPTSNEVGKFLVKDNAKIVESSINREIIIRFLHLFDGLKYGKFYIIL